MKLSAKGLCDWILAWILDTSERFLQDKGNFKVLLWGNHDNIIITHKNCVASKISDLSMWVGIVWPC